MGYSIKPTTGEHDFLASLKGVKVPLLVLDQKWHHLFTGTRKPEAIQKLEKQLDEVLKQQGRVQQELKELKKAKSTLMQGIVQNMDGAEGNNHVQSKKLDENKKLIDEVNEKIEQCEDILLDMPSMLKEANELLMQETMSYCYAKLRTNAADIEEIGAWIKDVRIELKKQIIRKQNAEIKNKEIYSYMHDIFGPQVIDVFDLQYESEEEEASEQEKKKDNETTTDSPA